MTALEEVNLIIKTLQAKPWREHNVQLLVSSQGKLATYMGNIGGLVAEAEYAFRLLEINHEQYELEQYFIHRKDEKMSAKDSENLAKIEAFAKERKVMESKKTWQELRAILKACESLSVACSTTLKHQKIDRANSNYQTN